MDDAPERVLYQPGFVDAWRTDLPPERVHIPAVEYIRSDVAQLAAPAVKVKPLVWVEIRTGQYFEARVIGILYSVRLGTDAIARWQAGYLGTWRDAPTIEAAKAAAQADYEARILAAIEAVPVAEVWRRAMGIAHAQCVQPANSFDNDQRHGGAMDCADAIRDLPLPDDLGGADDRQTP